MGLLAHQSRWRHRVAQTLSLLRRDSSRRRGDIDTSLDAARKSVPIAFRITIVMKMLVDRSGSRGCRTHWIWRSRKSV
jgi:hypothetical protein